MMGFTNGQYMLSHESIHDIAQATICAADILYNQGLVEHAEQLARSSFAMVENISRDGADRESLLVHPRAVMSVKASNILKRIMTKSNSRRSIDYTDLHDGIKEYWQVYSQKRLQG
jgi:hypothetical protein